MLAMERNRYVRALNEKVEYTRSTLPLYIENLVALTLFKGFLGNCFYHRSFSHDNGRELGFPVLLA